MKIFYKPKLKQSDGRISIAGRSDVSHIPNNNSRLEFEEGSEKVKCSDSCPKEKSSTVPTEHFSTTVVKNTKANVRQKLFKWKGFRQNHPKTGVINKNLLKSCIKSKGTKMSAPKINL